MTQRVWQIDAAQMTPFYNIAVCDGLSQAGCDVTYIASRYVYTELTYPQNIVVDHHYFKWIDYDWLLSQPSIRKILRGVSYPFDNWQLRQRIQSQKPDVVHFQWSRLPQFDLPLIRAIQSLNIPVIHTIHDITPLYDMGQVDMLFDIYRQCDGLIVHSAANRQSLLDTVSGLDVERIHIMPLVEVPFPKPQAASQSQARQRLNIDDKAFVILFQGSVKHYKGLDVLHDVIQNLGTDHNIIWLIVGKAGDAVHQDLMDTLKQYDHTMVIDEFIPNDAMWQYFLAADLSVFPYRHIYQSAALITAMGFGLPVIATDVGSFPETIHDNGVIVPKENPEALQDTILQLKDKPNLNEMGQKSLELIEQHHRIGEIGTTLKLIYQKILDSKQTY